MNSSDAINITSWYRPASLGAARLLACKAADGVCLAFPGLFLLGTTALETMQPGYNRVTDTISELVLGHFGWVETGLFLSFAAILWLIALRTRGALAPLALAGLGFVIIAAFPTEAPTAGPTMASLIHEYTAQATALLLPAACFCLAHRWQTDSEHRFIVSCSIAAGVVGLMLNLAGFLAVYGDTEWIGAIERLVMLNGLIWLELINLHLWLVKRMSRTSGVRSDFGRRRVVFSGFFGRTDRQTVKVPVSRSGVSNQPKHACRRS